MTPPSVAESPHEQPEPILGAVARGGFWTIASQLVGLGAALVATPFTLRLLGPASYGVWALLLSAVAWVGLADFGMGGASTRFAGEAHARHDADAEAVAVWTAAWLAVGATSLVAAAAAALAPTIADAILHVRPALRGSAILALRVVAGGVVISTATASLNTPLLVRLRYRTFALISQGSAVLQVVAVPVVLALSGGGVMTAAIVSTICGAITLAAVVLVGMRAQPAMRRPRFSLAVARRLIAFGGSLTVAGVADIPLTTAERIMLGHYRSSVQVAYYTVATRLATLASTVPATASQPLFPAVVRLRARGDLDAARRLYGQILQAGVLALTPLLLLVALVAEPFLSIWAGHAYASHSTVPCLVLLGGVWFQALSWFPLTYLMASDKGGIVARIRLLEIVPYVLGAAWLAARLGVLGAAIVWTARAIADSGIFFWVASRSEALRVAPLTERAGRAAALPCLLTAVVAATSVTIHGFPLRAALAVGLLAVYCAVAWVFVLTDAERGGIRQLRRQVGPTAPALRLRRGR